MTGESLRHNQVAGTIYARLRNAAAGGPGRVFFESVKLRVGDDIYYPDVIVTCSTSESDRHIVQHPCLLVEVTSPSTARFDRLEKLSAYRKVLELEAYLVVEQAWRRVVRHWLDASGVWQQEDLQGEGAIMPLLP